ncbi:MAG: alpha/beta hydrolase [Gammaproteobacteria bacterium]
MSLKAERKEINIKGESFSYLFFPSNSNKNPIFFLHATGLNAATYINFLSKLYKKFNGERTIYVLDQRGHGLTRADANHKNLKSWKTYEKDAINFINEIGVESCDIAGHSMGAIVSARISSKLKKIRKLIMIEPVLFYDFSEGFSLSVKRFFKIGDSSEISSSAAKRRKSFNNLESAIEHFTGRAIFKNWPDEALKNYLEGGLKETKEGVSLSCDPFWEAKTFQTVSYNTYKFLKNIHISAFILKGSMETSTFSEKAKEYVSKKYSFKIEEMSGSHFLPIENTDAVALKIADFLGK